MSQVAALRLYDHIRLMATSAAVLASTSHSALSAMSYSSENSDPKHIKNKANVTVSAVERAVRNLRTRTNVLQQEFASFEAEDDVDVSSFIESMEGQGFDFYSAPVFRILSGNMAHAVAELCQLSFHLEESFKTTMPKLTDGNAWQASDVDRRRSELSQWIRNHLQPTINQLEDTWSTMNDLEQAKNKGLCARKLSAAMAPVEGMGTVQDRIHSPMQSSGA